MTYRDARAWLDGFINLERRPDPAGWTTIKLERVVRLLELLGRPHLHGRVVHIAGSKGKGSTAAMVESVLRHSGARTGLYTSPDLVSHRERIRVSGTPISEAAVARLVAERLKPAAAQYAREGHGDELSFFDLYTALAFCWFAEADVEWNVIEVGLGGRLDATNVVHPTVCAITSLSLEHTQFLGDNLSAIAREKGGIIKPGAPVVLAPQAPEAEAVLAALAAERGSRLVEASGVESVPGGAFVELPDGQIGQRLRVKWGATKVETCLPLLGAHQAVNAAVARTLLSEAVPELDAATVAEGLAAVHWPGRLQVLGRAPWLLLDGAHTPESAERLATALKLFPHGRRCLIVGAARDKDVDGFLAAIGGSAARIIVTGIPGHPRAASAEELAPVARRHHGEVAVASDPAAAIEMAIAWAEPEDLVCVTGSLYLVGAVLEQRLGPEPA
jgi:dihydrofolate synthase/folylpolyglutamate synthase